MANTKAGKVCIVHLFKEIACGQNTPAGMLQKGSHVTHLAVGCSTASLTWDNETEELESGEKVIRFAGKKSLCI